MHNHGACPRVRKQGQVLAIVEKADVLWTGRLQRRHALQHQVLSRSLPARRTCHRCKRVWAGPVEKPWIARSGGHGESSAGLQEPLAGQRLVLGLMGLAFLAPRARRQL